MTDPERRGRPQPYRLTGEDTPKWLTLGFTLIGILTAVAAAWVLLSEQPALLEPPSHGVTVRKQSGSPNSASSAVPAVEPLHSSAEPSSTAAPETEPKSIPQALPPVAVTPSSTSTAPDQGERPSDQALGAQAPPPVTPVDCPQLVTIMFKRGSTSPISTDIETRFAPLRKWLTNHPEARLLVEGHADSKGSDQSNLVLSYRRAKAVVALLHKAGVPREQLVVLAAGEHQPIAGLPDSAASNRRVILQIEGSESCRASSIDSEPR